jgi:hypothetical protein
LAVYPDSAIRLAISQAVVVESPRGKRIAKEKQSHKIDVVIALAMAALGAAKEGPQNEPGIIEFTRTAALRMHQQDAALPQPRPPGEELNREEDDEEEQNELIRIYREGQEEITGSRHCHHCRQPIIGTSTFNGLHHYHPECYRKRMTLGLPV